MRIKVNEEATQKKKIQLSSSTVSDKWLLLDLVFFKITDKKRFLKTFNLYKHLFITLFFVKIVQVNKSIETYLSTL